MEDTAFDGQFYVAVYFAEFCIIISITALWVCRIEIISSTSTSEDAVFAIEFSTFDGK